MGIAKKIMMFAVMGAVLSALIAGLASIAPNIFGWLTLPFWLLPATLNIGAHDVEWPLFALSGTLCYGILAFLASRLWRHHRLRR